MKKLIVLLLMISMAILFGCSKTEAPKEEMKEEGKELPVTKLPNMKSGAEFYFSPDSKSMIGNAKYEGDESHKIYTINIDGTNLKKINGDGETACSYYFPDGKKLIWTSTHDLLDLPKGEWSDPRNYPTGAELYTSDLDGGNIVR